MSSGSVQNQSCNTQASQPPNNGLDDNDAKLNGLRNLLHDWNAGEGLRRQRDEILEKARCDDAKASIYSMYNEHAVREDKELVSRWSETLNILLTFAGLQSAVVTAFIVNIDTDLKQDPSVTTNHILAGILATLNNSTELGQWQDNDNLQHNARVVSEWWYVSLACSLLSAFGALMCKQWVLHYRSRPAWANTSQRRAQLRELRYRGLKTWWFFGIIDSLTILLQMSVFFFGVGLAVHLYRTALALFIVVEAFLTSGTIFYIIAMVAGVLYPSCPFKSRITEFTHIAGWTIVRWVLLCLRTMHTFAYIIVGWLCRYNTCVGELINQLRNAWRLIVASNQAGKVGKGARESLVVGEHTIRVADTGILCWWAVRQHDLSPKRARQPDTKVAVDVLTSMPPTVMLDHVNGMEFQRWAGTVVENLDNLIHGFTPSTTMAVHQNRAVQAGDALCHFMHQSPAVTHAALLAVEDEKSDNVGHFCQTIREAWTGLGGAELFPIHTMRWATISVYLRVQLLDWCSPVVPRFDGLRYRDLVVKEMPALLRDLRLQKSLVDAANVVSLAAVALVEDDAPGVHSREELMRCGPCEQLLLAIHRLSHYNPNLPSPTAGAGPNPSTQPSQSLFSLLIKTSRIVLAMEVQASGTSSLLSSPSLKSGLLGDALLRLLTLGTFYRDHLPSSSKSQSLLTHHHIQEQPTGEPPGSLLQELHALIVEIVEGLASHPELGPGLLSLSSSMGLACIFDAYAHKDATEPLNHESLQVLDYTLGLRHRRSRSPFPFTRRQSNTPPNLRYSNVPSLIEDNPQVLDQLIHDVQDALVTQNHGPRRLLLSVIAKGKDIFFPFDVEGNYGNLLQELSVIAQQLTETKDVSTPSESCALAQFHRWMELLQALRDSAVLLKKC